MHAPPAFWQLRGGNVVTNLADDFECARFNVQTNMAAARRITCSTPGGKMTASAAESLELAFRRAGNAVDLLRDSKRRAFSQQARRNGRLELFDLSVQAMSTVFDELTPRSWTPF
ncbi:hypothetical protein WKR88_23925 [Trinickia caryophylli]|uniref:hypothetical protein n=1 Tax=Trinickia caryophylli TaxID=28094 RepID=UPI00111BEDA3|nr:hypothetical protein [Trinickia caryophylli]TRX14100.1 hypothetical protein FNF07_22480 [Trinickia caryophylli]WQE13920.1 hypothetical protein U0034_24680 [Trinickia caryophylli]